MTDNKTVASGRTLQIAKTILFGGIVLGLLYFGALQITQQYYSDTSEVTLVTYSSERFGVSMLHPSTWTPQETSDEDIVKVISFGKPVDPAADPAELFSGQLLVDVQEASSEEQVIEAAAFFESLEQNVQSSLGRPESALESEEYAELGAKENITVDGFEALKVTVNITNYDNRQGETGRGVVLFVFVNPSKQVTVLYEGHSSDSAIFESFDQIIESVDIEE